MTILATQAGDRVSLANGLLNLAIAPIQLTPPTVETAPSLSLRGSIAEATGLQLNADGSVLLRTGSAEVSGRIDVSTASGSGGQVQILGEQIALKSSVVEASTRGAVGNGGEIRIGGDFKGQGSLPRAQQVKVDGASRLRADAEIQGNGGKVIVWSDDATQFAGQAKARGGQFGGNGGLVETSGKRSLDVRGAQVNASAAQGLNGEWLLDPTDIDIANAGRITPGTIETALDSGTNVTVSTAGAGTGAGDITLSNSINQSGGGNASLTLTGRRFNRVGGAQINLTSTGDLTFNLNQVNPETNPNTTNIQNAIDAIGAVAGSRQINLGAGIYRGTPGFSLVNVNENVAINGLNRATTILDGSNTSRNLFVTAGTVATVSNLTIQNGLTGAGESGAGILNNGNLTLDTVTVQNNIAGLDGGGIDSSAPTSSLTVGNSTVLNNQAAVDGGGLFVSGNTQLFQTSLVNNRAGSSGGAIYNIGNLTLSNGGINLNQAAIGGGIANVGSGSSLVINDFSLGRNQAAGNGGGIFNQLGTVSLTDGSLTQNISGNNGGGIWSNGPVSLLRIGLNGNQSENFGGGAFLTDTTATVQVFDIVNNTTGIDGGGLRLERTNAVIRDGEFGNNQAQFGGGLEATDTGFIQVDNVSFYGNVAEFGGGLLNDNIVVMVLNDAIFDGNQATTDGGALLSRGTLTLNRSNLFDNQAAQDGAGIRNLGTLTVNATTFTDNIATRYGAGINNTRQLTVDGSSFLGGQAIAGGGIYNASTMGQAAVSNSLFEDNVATRGVITGDGAGIYNVDNNVTVVGSTFRNNQAEDLGGAIASRDGNVSLSGSEFAGNTAGAGGALYQNAGELVIANSRFLNNQSQAVGGALDLFGITNSTIQTTLIQGNRSATLGGGIHLGGTTSLTLEQVDIDSNQAATGGGINGNFGQNFSGILNINNSTISNNQAIGDPSTSNGGGIDVNPIATGGTVNLTNSTLNGNRAARDGGAIAFSTRATVNITNSTLTQNQADNHGGAIAAFGSLNLSHVTIADNRADADNDNQGRGGGLLDWPTPGDTTINNTIVARNQAAIGADVSGTFVDQGNNLIGTVDGATGFTLSSLLGTSTNPLDPLLAPLGNYGGVTETLALLPGSLAIAGGNSMVPSDQRGINRLGAADIGAFESRGFVVTGQSGTPQRPKSILPLPR
ncbi:MAG: hypothetical protein HC824_15895, partial [Synechococcales cyanobacterium RM1_1_8]|nr:hypothetical protein [Synechococcales cyanobacterium RM1_1_8]